MKEAIIHFSQYKQEPEAILQLRLHAHAQLKDATDYVLCSFDTRDEAGFGVIANIANDTNSICQYGTLTTLEQLDYTLMQAGVVMCDVFDAMAQYDLTNAWQQLSLEHQAYTNSGVFIYVPDHQKVDVMCYFVQDNSVVEDLVKSVIIVKGKNAQVNVTYHEMRIGERSNKYQLECVEIDAFA